MFGPGDQDSCRDANLHLSRLPHAKGSSRLPDDRPQCGHDRHHWRDMSPHHRALIRN